MSVRVGFIGAGKMATALAKGIVSQGQILKSTKDLLASCPVQDAELLKPIQDLGGQTMHDNKALVANSDVVVLAVKPLIIPRVLQEIKKDLDEDKLLVSIAAGIKIGQIQQDLDKKNKVRQNRF